MLGFILPPDLQGQASGSSLAGWAWLRISHEAWISTRTIVSGAGGAASVLTHIVVGGRPPFLTRWASLLGHEDVLRHGSWLPPERVV